MKSEPKTFASLSSGLLARKGAARPAMRPQGFGQGGGSLEDLGWDDMGFEPPRAAVVALRDDKHDAFGEELEEQPLRNPVAALTPVQSPVHSQHAQIADRLEKNFRRTVFAAPGAQQLHASAPRPAGGFGRRVAGQ